MEPYRAPLANGQGADLLPAVDTFCFLLFRKDQYYHTRSVSNPLAGVRKPYLAGGIPPVTFCVIWYKQYQEKWYIPDTLVM